MFEHKINNAVNHSLEFLSKQTVYIILQYCDFTVYNCLTGRYVYIPKEFTHILHGTTSDFYDRAQYKEEHPFYFTFYDLSKMEKTKIGNNLIFNKKRKGYR
eukprot:UN03504